MNRLNAIGNELIERKKDLITFKSQDRVYDALIFQINEALYEKNIIGETTRELLLNNELDLDSFRKYLLSQKEFLKSDNEIKEDFNKLRNVLVDEIERQNLKCAYTDYNIHNSTISIFRTYMFDEDYALKHFDIESDKIDKLMELKGFMSFYSVLRLPKILNDFIENVELETDLFTLSHSQVYENINPKGFNIDLILEIKVSSLEESNMLEIIVSHAREKIEECDLFFEQMTA